MAEEEVTHVDAMAPPSLRFALLSNPLLIEEKAPPLEGESGALSSVGSRR